MRQRRSYSRPVNERRSAYCDGAGGGSGDPDAPPDGYEPETAPEGSWHSQAFLHYVDVNGPHSKLKYDGRESLGVIHPDFLKGFQQKNNKKDVNNFVDTTAVFLPSMENKPRYIEFS